MRIVKHGIIPRRIKLTCGRCGCVFVEKRNKVAIYDHDWYIKLTTYCPQCGEYVWSMINKPEEDKK